MQVQSPLALAAQHLPSELDELGDAIAELSAHLDAATARLLILIREFEQRPPGELANIEEGSSPA